MDYGGSSRSFDFGGGGGGGGDVLCSYDDYANHDPSTRKRIDPSDKDLNESRVGKSLVKIYEQENYSKDEVHSVVEKCMKKYADNLLRSLEGITGRLSQLEMFCYKLERSIGELRSDMSRDQGKTELKFISLDKHLQEVQRSIQLLRDKQELSEAQKELAKLQLIQKETHTKNTEVGPALSVSEPSKAESKTDAPTKHLALVPASSAELFQPNQYYLHHQIVHQNPQTQPARPELQYVRTQQVQVLSQTQTQTRPQPLPQYQQQWAQHPVQSTQPVLPVHPVQQVQPVQQPLQQMQSIRPLSYPTYPPHQSSNPNPNPNPESYATSMPMQVPTYGAISQPQKQTLTKTGYFVGGPYMQPGYMYPPNNSVPGVQAQMVHSSPPHLMLNHPYGEMIEKAVGMGFNREQVLAVIQRMADSGQTVDFNALLDRLNELGPGALPYRTTW